MNVMKWDPAIPIENNMITRSVESAQSKVEGQNFEIRKYLVDYDDVVNIQRDVIYRMRDQVLSKSDLRVMISGYLSKELEMISSRNLGVDLEERDVDLIYRELSMVFPDNSDLYDKDQLSEITLEDFDNNINEYINIMFNKREIEFGDEVFIDLQKTILLMSIDQHWVDHLTIMDNMRQGIGLEAAGQRDPLIQYKRMSYQMFNELTERIGSTVARSIFRLAMNSNSTRPHKSNKKSSIPKKTKNQFENENKNEINRKLSRQDRWLNFSDPLGGFSHLQIKEFTNQKVYDSIISFYYGVIVERSLIIDTQEKYYKKNIGAGIPPNENFCENVFTDLYNLTYSNLREDYNKNFSINQDNKLSNFLYDENKFTYWLFKIRILNSQPEKLASDTKRGLDRLMNVKYNHFKKLSNDILNNKNYK